jgi:hypothetical protein
MQLTYKVENKSKKLRTENIIYSQKRNAEYYQLYKTVETLWNFGFRTQHVTAENVAIIVQNKARNVH